MYLLKCASLAIITLFQSRFDCTHQAKCLSLARIIYCYLVLPFVMFICGQNQEEIGKLLAQTYQRSAPVKCTFCWHILSQKGCKMLHGSVSP